MGPKPHSTPKGDLWGVTTSETPVTQGLNGTEASYVSEDIFNKEVRLTSDCISRSRLFKNI